MDAQNVQDVAQNAAEPMGTSDPVHLEAEPALLKRKSASLEEEDETKPGVASGRQIGGKEQDQSVSRPKNPPKLLELRRSPDYFFEDGNVYLLVCLSSCAINLRFNDFPRFRRSTTPFSG